MASAGAELRRVLKQRGEVAIPGSFDPLSAVLVQAAGFPVAYLGGWATGAHLCVSEPMTTLTEQVEAAERCVARLQVPLIVDGGAGFGGPVHAARTVREFERVGVAAIHIEDQVYPKRAHYHRGLEHVVSFEEFLAKLGAAIAARRDPEFLVIGRTDARHAVGGSLEECARRCLAMREAGIEVIMPMLKDPSEMRELRERVPDVALVALAGPDSPAIGDLHSLGYQVVIFPSVVLLCAVSAIGSCLEDLRSYGKVRSADPPARHADVAWPISARTAIEDAMQLESLLKLEAETVEVGGQAWNG